MRLAVLLMFLVGCKNAPIDDGAQFGPWTQVKTFFTSSFVAQTETGVVLIDAGYSPKGAPVEAHLESIGHGLQDVSDVLITHGHTDHVRGLEAYPNARVHAHADEVDLIEEEGPEGVDVDATVADGEVIELDGLSVEVFHVPGHTAGNLVFLSEGVLLTGDTAMLYRDGAVGPAPERYADDPEAAAQSLRQLRDRLEPRRSEIDAVVFAHSGGLADTDAFWDL